MRPSDFGETGGPFAAEPSGELDITEYLRKLRQRWRLILLIVAASMAVAAIHYVITPEEYLAETKIQIERRSLSPFTTSQTPWLENWWNMEYYPTQYALLQSRGLAERVVENLRLAEDPDFNPGAALASSESAGKNATHHDDRASLGMLANRLLAGLTVEPVGNTQLVALQYRSSSPEFAARAANGFAEAFIDWGIETRSTTVGRASSFLASQIDSLKAEIQDKETQLQAFSRSEDIVALDPSTNVTIQRLQALNRDYIDAKRTRLEKQSHYEELMSAPRETVADTEANGLVSTLMQQQLGLEREYETKLKRFKPDWPEMVELKAELDKGHQHLDKVVDDHFRQARQAAYAEYQTALRQERALSQEIEELKKQAMDQNSAAAQYANLKVEVETRRDLLDELLRKQSETEVTARLQETRDSNIRVVDRALVPGAAFRPSLRKDLSLGLMLGLLLGVGLVVAIELLDRTLKTPEEVERLLGLATLTVVPDISTNGGHGHRSRYGYGYGARPRRSGRSSRRWLEKKTAADAAEIELIPHQRPRLAVSESYRALRTALLLSTAEELRMVAVTSPGTGEGKTVTSSNLAVVMAQLGRQVLLIDADLRKPRLHQVFHVSNRTGLVNFLTGNLDLENIFARSGVAGLTLVPSGPIPPNPSELLASERMREMLAHVRSRFDMVILDTPPVLAVTDATLVGTRTDGVILCLRAGKVLREDARNCYNRLHLADIRILGAVLNGFRSNQGGYGRGYRYYEAYAASSPDTGSMESGSAA